MGDPGTGDTTSSALVRWADSVWVATPRDRITVTGPDAGRYLHSQMAQDISSMSVGERRWSLLLEPTGRVVALLGVERVDSERFVLDGDAGTAEAVEARLRRFLLRVAVAMEVDAAAGPVPVEVEAERIRTGWPRVGADIISGETIPAETGVVPFAVSFTKGCYPGQELVERMDSRSAAAPYRLVRLIGDGLVAGDPVVVDGDEVGRVTSAASGAAIARVRRTATLGTPLGVGT